MISFLLKAVGGKKLLVDYNHYKRLRNCSFLKLFIVYPEFRYQFFYRLRLHSPFLRILFKPLQLINPLKEIQAAFVNAPMITAIIP